MGIDFELTKVYSDRQWVVLRAEVFDVANAITASAKSKPSTTSRLMMEEVGHRYLTSRVS